MTTAAAAAESTRSVRRTTSLRAFFAICSRDLFVTSRQLPSFLAQALIQPAFMLFVFAEILPKLGWARPGYGNVLVPGIIAVTAVLTALQSTALPLVLEFGYTKEIEDRLLAPLPVSYVAYQKLVVAALRGLAAALIVVPLSYGIVRSGLSLSADHLPQVALFLVLASFLGAALGLTVGTFVDPRQITVVFAVVFTPLFFTGCTQYPWQTLDKLLWFKIVTLFNPLTYASEGLRGALSPSVAHMHWWVAALALFGFTVVLAAVGRHGFLRRCVE
jgi:ABC-2 type transport system permease protein